MNVAADRLLGIQPSTLAQLQLAMREFAFSDTRYSSGQPAPQVQAEVRPSLSIPKPPNADNTFFSAMTPNLG